jgi:hypothetical protein
MADKSADEFVPGASQKQILELCRYTISSVVGRY